MLQFQQVRMPTIAQVVGVRISYTIEVELMVSMAPFTVSWSHCSYGGAYHEEPRWKPSGFSEYIGTQAFLNGR